MKQFTKLLLTCLLAFTSFTALDAQTRTTPTNYINATLSGANFINANQRWAVGASRTIFTKNNGGKTLTIQTSVTIGDVFGVYFTTSTMGWTLSTNTFELLN
jgi:hypothetical protein